MLILKQKRLLDINTVAQSNNEGYITSYKIEVQNSKNWKKNLHTVTP